MQILETDPECRSIRTKEGILPAYNIQTVVDDESHMIVAFETTNASTDQGLLDQMAEQTKQELDIEVAEFTEEIRSSTQPVDIQKCLQAGVLPDCCKGKEKVSAEIALSYLAYDLRRAMGILGIGVLVARIRERNRKYKG